MAGNKFTKKLQAIKSKMMLDDQPVDMSRRKMITLPAEQASSKPQMTIIETITNTPVDRRGFLNKMANTAKSTALRGALPELGRLVEPAVEKALPQPTDFSLAETKIKDALSSHISNLSGEYEDFLPSAFSIISKYIDTSKFKSSELKKLNKLSKLAEEGNYNAAEKLEEAMYEMVDNLKPGSALDVLDQVVGEYDELTTSGIAQILNAQGDIPHNVIHDYLDTHHPYYDEDAINEILKDSK